MSIRPPDAWVKKLLSKIAAMYGQKFANQWASVPEADMVEMWGDAIGPYIDAGEHQGRRIKWALTEIRESGSPFPPTLPEFVGLLKQAPRPQPIALPGPVVAPEVVQARADELARAAARMVQPKDDLTAWAKTAPAQGYRQSWTAAIIECAEKHDSRFVSILSKHVDSGVIASDRATAALGRGVAS